MATAASTSSENAFSNLQLRLNCHPGAVAPPQEAPSKRGTFPADQTFVMMEEYYFYDQGGISSDSNNNTGNSEFYYANIRSGKKLTVFVIACIDLGLSCLGGFFEGKSFLYSIIYGHIFMVISSLSSLLLTFAWFIAAWKLLESSYLRRRVILRYQLAKFWRISNLVLLFVFLASALLATVCLFTEECNVERDVNLTIWHFLQTTFGYCVLLVLICLFCVERVASIWLVNKYIDELRNDLSSDSFPLQLVPIY